MNVRELETILSRRGKPRVLIVGDLILDAYVSGDVARISPEAPIPVLTAKRREERLGGAGNVAANLVAMGAEVDVVGVIGDDPNGLALRKLLGSTGINADGCAVDSKRPTTLKTRMMSGSHQMLRVDWEESGPVGDDAGRALVAELKDRVKRAKALVLSDYGKGVLTDAVLKIAIEAARAAKIPVLVDPKGDDYKRYRGATLLTPNRKEAEQALGRKLGRIDDMERAADDLMKMSELDAAVITLGSDGIYFKTRGGESGHVPAQARAVFDVTGAGDTVVAQLAFHLGDGVPLGAAVELANQAAAITVGRLGTHAVSRSELAAHLAESFPHGGKVVRGNEVEALLAQWRKEGKRIVFTNGCFDLLHVGHVSLLRFAKGRGDVLIVGVNDDASVKRAKGEERPVTTLDERMEMLAALEMVDAVTSFGEDTPLKLIERVTPHVLVKGQDWADKGVVGREWVESHGGTVAIATMVPGKSTTNILERSKKNSSPAC